MDLAFRNKIVSQINRLNRNKLCRRIYITDVVPVPKNDFETWNDDGREWRESVLKCSTLERFESTEDNTVRHEIYRKKFISEYFSQDTSAAPTEMKKEKLLFRYAENNVSVLRRRCKTCQSAGDL